jgi:predicted transcriptional regulator
VPVLSDCNLHRADNPELRFYRCQRTFVEMDKYHKKWKYIADSFKKTRKARQTFEKLTQERISLRQQLKELSSANKKQTEDTFWQHAVAIENERTLHEEEMTVQRQHSTEELRRINAKWKERNGSLQAQLDSVKTELAALKE